jgi:trans-2,3-dihydro-3-hydroxyanthranilate isomerase
MLVGMELELAYDVVDVFSDRPYAGNPLAVVHGTEGLSADELLALAREFNLSETAFPTPRADGRAYDVRIFTPAVEIPFAGHPTVGTAWVLRQQAALLTDDVVQHCGVGPVPVRVAAEGAELAATPRHVQPRADAAALAESLGLPAADAVGVAYEASCGLGWLFLLARPGAVVRSRWPGPDWLPQMAGPDPVGGLVVAEVEPPDSDPGGALAVHARVFCPEKQIVEDAATGSAAAALGLVLVSASIAAADGTTRYTISQGAEIGRPSMLEGRVEARDGRAVVVHVGGRVVRVARGHLVRPGQPPPPIGPAQ